MYSPKNCKRCETKFIPTSGRSLYCKPTCRYNDEYDRYKDKHRESARLRAQTWREKNRDHHRKYSREWEKENPEKVRENQRIQQHHRRAKAGKHDSHSIEYMNILYQDPCCYCGAPTKDIDHIEPVSRGGRNEWENLTAACKSCNGGKRDRSLLTFLLSS